MFLKDRNYIINPFLIKRLFEGKYPTFNVNPLTYDPESGFVQMTDVEIKEGYSRVAINNQIGHTSKNKVIYAKSYEEYLYLKKKHN